MSIDQAQTEHDIFTLRTLLHDLSQDWRTQDGRRVLKDNAAMIENALDDLSRLVEAVRAQSFTVDLRTLETV